MSIYESADKDESNQSCAQSTVVNVQIPAMKTGAKVKHHSSILMNNDIYVFGGEDQMTNEPLTSLYVFKVKSGYLKSISINRLGYTPPLSGGVVFQIPVQFTDQRQELISFGGTDFDDMMLPTFSTFDLLANKGEADVKMNGTWEVPGQRKGHSCVTIGDAHYFYGGVDPEGKLIGGVWKFDTNYEIFSYIHPKISKSIEGAQLPGPSAYHAACAYGTEMLVFGGDMIALEKILHIYRFDTVSKLWGKPITVPNDIYPNGVSFHKMIVVGDFLVIVGGIEASTESDESDDIKEIGEKVVFYNLVTDTWYKDIVLQGRLGSRLGHTIHAIDDQIWVIGGDIENIADQDVVVLQSDLLSNQNQIQKFNMDLSLLREPLDTTRESFPPPKSAFDSVIIGYREGITLNKWYGERRQKWRLLYRATRDGFHSSNWHSKVDHQGPTLSIVLVQGYIFGGFTKIPWHTSGADQYDDDSWIFSLKNPHDNNQYKFMKIPQNVKRMRSVYHASGYGLWFGANDILIYSNANSNSSSNACLGKAFEYTLSYDPNTFFCGASGFKVDELETFALL